MTVYVILDNVSASLSPKMQEFLETPCLLKNRLSVERILRSFNNYIHNSDSETERIIILSVMYELVVDYFKVLHTDIIFIRSMIERLRVINSDSFPGNWKEEMIKKLGRMV